MGSSASKAAKKAYPSAAAGVAREGIKFTPPPAAFPSAANAAAGRSPPDGPSSTAAGSAPLATDSRPDELERSGGRDPAFLSKLAELGQVSTQGGKPAFTAPRANDPNPAQDLLRRRDLDPISFPSGSGEESSPTEAESHNRLDAPTLIALLAARREARTPEEARSVAESYGVDLELVDRLATFVNPPSVQQDVVRKTDDGNETPVALWVDPVVSASQARGEQKKIA